MTRIFFAALLLFALVTATAACDGGKTGERQTPASFTQSSELTPEQENLVIDYIESNIAHKARGGQSFAAIEVYGVEQYDRARFTVYLWAYFMEYLLQDGALVEGGGGSFPLAVYLERDCFSKDSVAGHDLPLDGANYADSVESIFPGEYHDAILNRTGSGALAAAVLEKAHKYFGL